jgi:hypothetical protein
MAQFEKVSYQRVFNMGNYESIRIGADVIVNAGEDAKSALNEAKEFVEQWQKENSIHHYADNTPDIPIIPKEVRPEKYKDSPLPMHSNLLDDINSCTELKILESYVFLAKRTPALKQAYDNKLKELQ